MQTFLPYPDFVQSARTLDTLRLGKQIIEAGQILRAITDPDYGWQHHPAVNMWRGYERSLWCYITACADEWLQRRDNVHGAYRNLLLEQRRVPGLRVDPPWLGDPAFHLSHRSNLYRKDPDWYGDQPGPFADELQAGDLPWGLDYVWPSTALKEPSR